MNLKEMTTIKVEVETKTPCSTCRHLDPVRLNKGSFCNRLLCLIASPETSTCSEYKAEKLNLKIEIRRNSDGAIAVNVWTNWFFNTYWWTDGSASCDCNRELFFQRARGEDDSGDPECGEGRYSVRLSDADTGEVLYDELKTPA